MVLACAVALSAAAGGLNAQRFGAPQGPVETTTVEPLRFRYMGPAAAGRIASVAGIPGDTSTYYLGSASGGLWKSTDSGATFVPIFDNEPVAAIGALAVAPSDPNQVWAGTGEAWVIRDADVMGDGIYKSTDGGKTWKNMGGPLKESGRIGRIIVHPADPNTVYVCTIGRVTGPQQERGVYRTKDGGETWQRILFVNPDTGCSGLAMAADDPNTLIAGMWQVIMHTWGEFSGTWDGYKDEPGSGVHITHDGGNTWTKVTDGMPKPPVGKIDVAIAPSKSKRMFALIQTADQGSLWRSDDGGATFKSVSWDRRLIGRAGYYIRIAVNPQNADDVLVLNSGFWRSSDGGLTFNSGRSEAGGCGDCHDVWMDPKDGHRFVLTDDGGARIISPAGNKTVRLPNGQMYHVATDNRVPYWIYSNRQDDGTMRGPSNVSESTGNGVLPDGSTMSEYVESLAPPRGRGRGGFGRGRGAPAEAWQAGLGGCESGFTFPDTDPNIVWSSCYGNEITRWDAATGIARSVSPWIHTLDSEPNKAKYRCHWTPPAALDPLQPHTVYYGCQVIFKTSDGGQNWEVISPDLSTQDPSRIVSSGGIVGDNLGQFYGEVVFAIAPSPVEKGLLWAGTNDGKLWYMRNGKWTDVSKNVGMPPWGTISQISPSNFDPAIAYVAVDYHMMDDREPYLYKTKDFGRTWTRISDGLPHGHPLAYVKSVAENPNRQGMLFAGTGNGFFYSMDDGATWTKFTAGLPPAPVTWITVQKRAHDVVISTYGRGLFILPNISMLEQTGQTTPPAGTKLYAPTPAVRQARTGRADFLFSLASAPSSPIDNEILDQAGTVIRKEQVKAHAGLNRATWDLREEGPADVELRTTPPQNPHIWDEPRFRNSDTRPVDHWGIEGAQHAGPIAAPGTYTVRMTLDGQPVTETFDVVKDPAIAASDSDLVASTAAQRRIRDDMNTTVDITNRLEIMRRQIEDQLKANAGKSSVTNALTALNQKMLDVEYQLVTKSDMMSDDKYYPEQYRVYQNLIWLNGVVGLGAGDVAGGADYRPTPASMQVLDQIEAALKKAQADFDALMATDVPAFNKSMGGKVPAITDTPRT
jgi:photosystem II stability/assembly factor-like uncharacterized protein